MATIQWSALRRIIRADYGLEDSATEDALLADTYLLKCANKEIALIQALGKTHKNDALSASLTSGDRVVTLSELLIEPDPTSFRFMLSGGSTYTALKLRQLASLRKQYGPFEDLASSASVAWVYLRPGDDDSPLRVCEVFPPPNANGTLKYGGWVYTAAMTADSDVVPFTEQQAALLVPGTILRLATWEGYRGREINLGQAEKDAIDARTELLRQYGVTYKHNAPAQVAQPRAAGAEERRRAAPAGGA